MKTLLGLFMWSMVLVTIAFAAETTPAAEVVLSFLNAVVFPVASAFILGMIGVVVDKIRVKYNLKISQEQEALLETYALQGIALAQEKAAAYAKKKIKILTGSEKLDIAVNHMMSVVPKITPAQADKVVHAVLGKTVGAGATGDEAVTV